MMASKAKRNRQAGVDEKRKADRHRPIMKSPALIVHDDIAALDWYVLKTLPQREHLAEILLDDMGMTVFNPIENVPVRTNRRSTGKPQVRERAILTSMILLGHPHGVAVPWFEVFKLSVVTGVIFSDGHPALIGPKAMRHLLRRSGRRAVTRKAPVAVHSRVAVMTGPFTGWEGKVVALTDNHLRAIIAFDDSPGTVDMPANILEGVA